jgi:hypothetical protein
MGIYLGRRWLRLRFTRRVSAGGSARAGCDSTAAQAARV